MLCQQTGAWSRYYAGVATTRICQPALTDPETRYATIKKKWDIKHTPTSTFNRKANGKVEAAVKSDKRLRNKTAKGGDDFYLGLLAERKVLTKREEGRQGCSWSVTKSVIKQKAKP